MILRKGEIEIREIRLSKHSIQEDWITSIVEAEKGL